MRKIKVFHIDYDIKRVSKKLCDKEQCWGYHEPHPPVLAIQEGIDGGRAADTLIHELFHAILSVMGTGQVVSTDPVQMEEHFVGLLASGLTSVIRDNPALLSYLAKQL